MNESLSGSQVGVGAPIARPITPPVAEAIAGRLRVLGQPVRVGLVDRLDLDGERSVGALAEALGESLHNVSQHLAVLRAAGLVRGRHQGREVRYRLSDHGAIEVYELVAATLVADAERLGRLIEPGE